MRSQTRIKYQVISSSFEFLVYCFFFYIYFIYNIHKYTPYPRTHPFSILHTTYGTTCHICRTSYIHIYLTWMYSKSGFNGILQVQCTFSLFSPSNWFLLGFQPNLVKNVPFSTDLTFSYSSKDNITHGQLIDEANITSRQLVLNTSLTDTHFTFYLDFMISFFRQYHCTSHKHIILELFYSLMVMILSIFPT